MSKKPISFRTKQRERRQRQIPLSRQHSGQWQDITVYWRRMAQDPFQFAGRQLWTESMLWINALAAGLIRAVGTLVWNGVHPMLFISTTVNGLFVAVMVYYLMTWVIAWVVNRLSVRRAPMASPDLLKPEIIVLSGWFLVLSALTWLPNPTPYWIAVAGFAVLVGRAVQHSFGIEWYRAAVATVAGFASVVLLLQLLMHL